MAQAQGNISRENAARDREVHRFYQPWLETFHNEALPTRIAKLSQAAREDGHTPQSSRDRALTAFAQLGAVKLQVKRGVVTLIDTRSQYVLAEATQSLSLMDDARHAPGDELWLGNSRIPRGQGVSEDALEAGLYTAKGPGSEEYSARALVVDDLAVHPTYKDKEYAGAGISFYAGVPIITPRGHTIGVYNVTDNKRREGLKAEELRFMNDMATLVVQHLDTIRNERARARGERLIQGIGSFIEGDPIDASLALESPGPNLVLDPLDAAGQKQPTRPQIKSRNSSGTFKGLSISDANSMARDQYSSHEESSNELESRTRTLPPVQREPVENHSDPYKAKEKPKSQHALVFDRAAKIMRKCLGADGVAFLDASSANLSKGTARRESRQSQNSILHHTLTKKSQHDTNKTKPQSAITPEDDLAEGTVSISAEAERSTEDTPEHRQLCDLIASNFRDARSDQALSITEHDLRKLVRRHPQGKCYSFDESGKLASSDDSASEGLNPDEHVFSNGIEVSAASRKEFKRNALAAALPRARTIVFLPLWDFASQRWNAAGVMWSTNPAKLMNVNQDFSYLRAFANSVMNEIARLNLSVSDAAKATFLANISHELRSPLHGILGSIEFLHDTALDDFQSSMVISVETCGKTLLDTVNHVLDFAKLNDLSKKGSKKNSVSTYETKSHRPLTSVFDLATVVEEAVEAVYAGQVFRVANQDAQEGQGPALSSSNKAMMTRRQHKDRIAQGQAINSDAVRLTINIDDGIDWSVSSQPGAIRRIVMNLLGNSLKYTETGSINVALEVDRSRRHENETDLLHACLTVTDTGKGMSDDFVRNHAFTAFSQEDSLATGTGLGLSIIRSIVDSLGGKIDLRSQKNLGTEVKIWLSLPQTDKTARVETEKSILHQMSEKTTGMSLCLLKPPIHEGDQEKDYSEKNFSALRDMPTVEASLHNLLDQWFHMTVFDAPNMDNIRKADFFVYAEPPSIEYLLNRHGEHSAESEIPVIILCQNAFQASSLRADGIHHLTEIGRIIEIIAQPVGPQKLGKVLHRCMQRTKMLERSTEALSSDHVTLSLFKNDPILENGVDQRPGQDAATAAPNPTRKESHPGEKDERPQNGEAHEGTKSVRPTASPQQPPQPSIDPSLPSVLVVDDNQINLQLMVTFVRKARHAYESATDGHQAVEAYKRSAIDPRTGQPSSSAAKRFKYILMDVQMPKMDGNAATRQIRKWEKENGIEPPAKIFALTGLGEMGSHDWAHEAGFDRLLSKPIKFKDLNELLV